MKKFLRLLLTIFLTGISVISQSLRLLQMQEAQFGPDHVRLASNSREG